MTKAIPKDGVNSSSSLELAVLVAKPADICVVKYEDTVKPH
jgi:hypothetical protein